MSEINIAYDPKNIEEKLYKKWIDNGLFKGKIN